MKCGYCGSTEPAEGFADKNVVHRRYNHDTRKQEVVTSKFKVCKGMPCGGYLQMSYEG